MTPGSKCAHRQPVERRKAHCAFDAATARERAHRCAAAEVGHDDSPRCDLGRYLGQAARDEFIRQTMKSIPAHALGVGTLRDRVVIGKRTVAAMKGCIETGDLRKAREACQHRADRREVVWLVKRRQRCIALKIGEDCRVDQHWLVIFRAAMHDPMPDCDRLNFLSLTQPRSRDLQGSRHISHLLQNVGLIDQWRLVGCFGAQSWPSPDAIHLSFDQAPGPDLSVSGEHLELDTRGAGVDDENGVH